jgi:hypothetical protein
MRSRCRGADSFLMRHPRTDTDAAPGWIPSPRHSEENESTVADVTAVVPRSRPLFHKSTLARGLIVRRAEFG